ncbi:hypothetical protein PIB30_030400 [Stylosanthes scabra]|uniref:Uncharacterized protein n=1 Tax=Stylosanthes scabra TaxID=79078 RepID=A0ABU6YBX1_9FABA|nr:hypothetical protein [Stylosanthes scabra]
MSTKTIRPPPRRVPRPHNKSSPTLITPSSNGFLGPIKPNSGSPNTGPKQTLRVKKKERGDEEESGEEEKKKKMTTKEEVVAAGCLAHEYLTKGTLFGRMWEWDPQQHENSRSYVEVAQFLKNGGAHFPGVVNPSQLIRYLRVSPPSSQMEL